MVVAALWLPSVATAAPGDLDTTFSGDGKATVNFGGDDSGSDVALQSDGKAVIVGAQDAPDGDLVVARLNSDGSLDTSFDGDGMKTVSFGSGVDASGDAVAVQADGKIVVAGEAHASSATGSYDFAVARLNADGSLDTSFDGDGKTTIDFAGDLDQLQDLALQPDGRIVVVGEALLSGGNTDFGVVRLNTDGSLDTSFSGDGRATIDWGGFNEFAESVAVQSDGRLVVAGWFDDSAYSSQFAVARLEANGSLDSSFSGDGKATVDFGGTGDERAGDVVLQSDGKIVLAGGRDLSGDGTGDFALARLKTDGSLDSGFSGDGKVTIDFGQDDAAASVALQPDGKIVVGGSSVEFSASFPSDFALARVGAGGSIDDTFSADGAVTIDFGQNDGAASVALQPNGKIVASGSTGGGSAVDFAVARVEGGDGPQPQRTLTVSTTGTGSGTVTGPGISCPGDCTEAYTDDQNVTLSASPASGSTFSGFSGACSGSSCSLTMDADKSVTASFATASAPPDSDGDGVPDASDDCPSEAGPAPNGGCPVSPPPDDGDTPPLGDTTPPPGDTTPPQPDIGPTDAQIEAVLADQVKTAGKDLKRLGLDKLLKKGVFKAQVTALEPGRFVAKLRGGVAAKKAVTIAKGSDSFEGVDKGKVKVKLTKKGEKLLEKAKKAKDAVKSTFQLKFSADDGNTAKGGTKIKLK